MWLLRRARTGGASRRACRSRAARLRAGLRPDRTGLRLRSGCVKKAKSSARGPSPRPYTRGTSVPSVGRAPGRLVQDEQVRARHQRRDEDHLLAVALGIEAHFLREIQVEALNQLVTIDLV